MLTVKDWLVKKDEPLKNTSTQIDAMFQARDKNGVIDSIKCCC